MAYAFKPLLNRDHSGKQLLYLTAGTVSQQSLDKIFEERSTYETVMMVFHVQCEKYQQ